MFKAKPTRRHIARTLCTVLALALSVGVGGLSANGAAAGVAPETPVNVTAEPTTDADGVGTVVVRWDALVDPDSVYRIDVDLDGQDGRRVHSDRMVGVTFTGIDPGTYTAAVAFEYTDSSPDSDPVTVEVTVKPVPPVPGAPTQLTASPVTKGGRTTITWVASKAPDDAPVELYILSVDGFVTFTEGNETRLKFKGLRAGPATIKIAAVSESGFSKTAKIKINVAKSVARAPKRTLRLGMTGPGVMRLQTNLGMRHPNGTFNKKTQQAVISFQTWMGLEPTGVVNDRMRYLLDV